MEKKIIVKASDDATSTETFIYLNGELGALDGHVTKNEFMELFRKMKERKAGLDKLDDVCSKCGVILDQEH